MPTEVLARRRWERRVTMADVSSLSRELHSGMARTRASTDEASPRQAMLAEQVRAADAQLRERQAEPDRR